VNIIALNKETGTLEVAECLYLSDSEDLEQLIGQCVEKHELSKMECNVVLSSNDYQLLLVERPEVAEAELREAVKWKVKDLIQEPIESVVLDTFELPKDASKGKDMLYVVVVPLVKIQSLIDLVKESELTLKVIDIEVLALRNIISLKKLERASAVVRLAEKSGDVSIFRDNKLYLSRHFNLNYSGGLLDDLPAADLALEVQRSFDYFERQMGQVPPSTLFICGEGVGPEKITEELQRSVAAKVEYLDLSVELAPNSQGEEEIDQGILQLCMAAIGTTYRKEVA